MAVSIEIPTTEPRKLTAGDTWVWEKSLSDYLPSDNWVLSYSLVKQGKRIAITASDSSDVHLVEVAATTTAAYEPGVYAAYRHLTNTDNSDRYTESIGEVEILADFATQATGYDDRSFAKKMVDALESALPAVAAQGVASISVDGRSYSYTDGQSLRDDYDYWMARYNNEKRKASGRGGMIIKQRFSRG